MKRLAIAIAATAFCVQCLADDNDPFTYVGSISDGVDKALVAGYEQAAEAVAPGSEVRINARDAGKFASVSIEGSKVIVKFDHDGLSRQLSASGAQVWSGLKDPVLVWLADAKSGKIIGGDSDDPLAVAMSGAAQKLRYSLMFPLMDLDDVQAVNVKALLTHDDAALTRASSRYKPAFYVAAAASANSDGVDLRWDLYDQGGHKLGDGNANSSLNSAASKAASDIASVLMQNVSGDETQSPQSGSEASGSESAAAADSIGPRKGSVRILISGIGSVSDIMAVRSAIITFGYEGSTRVIGYTPQGVVFLVPTSASPAILDGTLAHSGAFTKTGDWIYKYNQGSGEPDSGRDGRVGTPSYKSAISAITTPGTTVSAKGDGETQNRKNEVKGKASGSKLVEDL